MDRDLVWMLDDWRLDQKGQIVEDFNDLHDVSHQGRIGNTAMLNGRVPEEFSLSNGERIRLRLVNVANAWIFGLEFKGHVPSIIAYDGHAVAPHAPADGLVVVGPAQRVDIILNAPVIRVSVSKSSIAITVIGPSSFWIWFTRTRL